MDNSTKKPQCRKPECGNLHRFSNNDISNKEINEISPAQANENRKQLEAIIHPVAKQKTVKQFSQDIAQQKAQRQIANITERK